MGLVLDQYGRTDWKTLVRRFNAHYQMHLDRQSYSYYGTKH
ncbi:RNA 2'-phosphotransferase, partial [Lacticaseibacillus paracasei subsp. paracasei Lpp123]